MQAAQLPEQLRTDCFCPSCRDRLVPGGCADPWAICLTCKAGHRFFIMPESPLSVDSGRAASLCLPELKGRSPETIMSFWLSEPAARSVLNVQLAQILRAVAERRRVLHEPLFSFCPICGGELSKYEQRDIWVQGLRCPAGHSWGLRSGKLQTLIAGALVGLQAEFSDTILGQLILAWLKGDELLDRQMHESVRHVLADHIENIKDDPQS